MDEEQTPAGDTLPPKCWRCGGSVQAQGWRQASGEEDVVVRSAPYWPARCVDCGATFNYDVASGELQAGHSSAPDHPRYEVGDPVDGVGECGHALVVRHEAGSRLLEAGWPLHNVAHMLGHANISQTSTYLNATKVGLQESMRRLDAARCNSVAIEGEIERAPRRNDSGAEAAQPLIN